MRDWLGTDVSSSLMSSNLGFTAWLDSPPPPPARVNPECLSTLYHPEINAFVEALSAGSFCWWRKSGAGSISSFSGITNWDQDRTREGILQFRMPIYQSWLTAASGAQRVQHMWSLIERILCELDQKFHSLQMMHLLRTSQDLQTYTWMNNEFYRNEHRAWRIEDKQWP